MEPITTRSEIHTNALEGTYTLHVYEVDESGAKLQELEQRSLTYLDVMTMLEQDREITLIED